MFFFSHWKPSQWDKIQFSFFPHNVLWYFWNLSLPDVNDFIKFNFVFVFIKSNSVSKHQSSNHSSETLPRGRESFCLFRTSSRYPTHHSSPHTPLPQRRGRKSSVLSCCVKVPWNFNLFWGPSWREHSWNSISDNGAKRPSRQERGNGE